MSILGESLSVYSNDGEDISKVATYFYFISQITVKHNNKMV